MTGIVLVIVVLVSLVSIILSFQIGLSRGRQQRRIRDRLYGHFGSA